MNGVLAIIDFKTCEVQVSAFGRVGYQRSEGLVVWLRCLEGLGLLACLILAPHSGSVSTGRHIAPDASRHSKVRRVERHISLDALVLKGVSVLDSVACEKFETTMISSDSD